MWCRTARINLKLPGGQTDPDEYVACFQSINSKALNIVGPCQRSDESKLNIMTSSRKTPPTEALIWKPNDASTQSYRITEALFNFTVLRLMLSRQRDETKYWWNLVLYLDMSSVYCFFLYSNKLDNNLEKKLKPKSRRIICMACNTVVVGWSYRHVYVDMTEYVVHQIQTCSLLLAFIV